MRISSLAVTTATSLAALFIVAELTYRPGKKKGAKN